ncbi:hypothetical protein K438DRAFT_1764786 [Mycena galopus ATCC 62051]|nr:hypothetical protein K438DRAFT_1764786 [Mycena galopus ATCC 62051]
MTLGNGNGRAEVFENDKPEPAGATPHLPLTAIAIPRTVAIGGFSKSLTELSILDPTSPTSITSGRSACLRTAPRNIGQHLLLLMLPKHNWRLKDVSQYLPIIWDTQ